MSWNLSAPVGTFDNGAFCPNRKQDQQQVAELLMQIPIISGGLKTGNTSIIDLPPILDGIISAELLGAIQTFQTVQGSSLNIDLRVEPGGATWQLMLLLATLPQVSTPFAASVTLDPIGFVIEETSPQPPVAGLPAIAYAIAGIEQLLFDNGSLRISISMRGILTGSWGESFGLVCNSSPSFSSLNNALKTGQARNIGAAALTQACSELRAQTRFAANQLFSSVQVSSDGVGVFKISGSAGDKWRQLSVGYEYPNTIVATGSLTIQGVPVPLPSIGGQVRFSGTLQCTLKFTVQHPGSPEEASLLANLAVLLIAGRIVLVPVAAWLVESADIVLAREGVKRLGGLLAERIPLGLSPSF